MTQATTAPAKTRAQIPERTLRKDPWWRQPAINATALAVVVIYLTWASLVNADYFWEPYISPLYSPCLATTCTPGAGYDWIPWLTWLSPAIIIIGGPLGFRLTCYYYRKAYYRAFWRAPAACAVREPVDEQQRPGDDPVAGPGPGFARAGGNPFGIFDR